MALKKFSVSTRTGFIALADHARVKAGTHRPKFYKYVDIVIAGKGTYQYLLVSPIPFVEFKGNVYTLDQVNNGVNYNSMCDLEDDIAAYKLHKVFRG